MTKGILKYRYHLDWRWTWAIWPEERASCRGRKRTWSYGKVIRIEVKGMHCEEQSSSTYDRAGKKGFEWWNIIILNPCFPAAQGTQMYVHACVYFAGDKAQVFVLDKCSIIKIYPQPWTVNFLSRISDLEKQVLLCCSLNPVFYWNSTHDVTI